MNWCDECGDYHDNFKIVKTEKKRGRYYPYRDTMEAEYYTYTERSLKCLTCGKIIKVEMNDKDYQMSESRFEKWGRHSHYDT